MSDVPAGSLPKTGGELRTIGSGGAHLGRETTLVDICPQGKYSLRWTGDKMRDYINVGLIGIGAMGRTHFGCYRNNPHANITAICDIDERKRTGEWSTLSYNIGSEISDLVDVSGISVYESYADLIADPSVDLVDICLPTPLHASTTIEALRAGKDVFCEKPMAWDVDECNDIERAVNETGRKLMVGHCLRYWPQYVAAREIIRGGEFGDWRYASFHRSGGAPNWSWNNWLITGSQSGGVVLDMHIHDVDAALWWFGRPQSIHAAGVAIGALPTTVDSTWRYKGDKTVALHGSWDLNGGPFRYGFKVVLERGSLWFDSADSSPNLNLVSNDEVDVFPVYEESAYQLQLDDLVDCLRRGSALIHGTPKASSEAVEVAWEEMKQLQKAHQ